MTMQGKWSPDLKRHDDSRVECCSLAGAAMQVHVYNMTFEPQLFYWDFDIGFFSIYFILNSID